MQMQIDEIMKDWVAKLDTMGPFCAREALHLELLGAPPQIRHTDDYSYFVGLWLGRDPWPVEVLRQTPDGCLLAAYQHQLQDDESWFGPEMLAGIRDGREIRAGLL
ncbi:MAG: hypothetical protein ACYDAI_02530 [Trichloromonadaceae bacterium]